MSDGLWRLYCSWQQDPMQAAMFVPLLSSSQHPLSAQRVSTLVHTAAVVP